MFSFFVYLTACHLFVFLIIFSLPVTLDTLSSKITSLTLIIRYPWEKLLLVVSANTLRLLTQRILIFSPVGGADLINTSKGNRHTITSFFLFNLHAILRDLVSLQHVALLAGTPLWWLHGSGFSLLCIQPAYLIREMPRNYLAWITFSREKMVEIWLGEREREIP